MNKALPSPPNISAEMRSETTVWSYDEAASAPPRYVFTYTATGAEPEGVVKLFAEVVDEAANSAKGLALGNVSLDFSAPDISFASVAYQPGSDNPLSTVSAATSGTTIIVSVLSSEPLDPSDEPTLSAAHAGVSIPFTRLPQSTSLSFLAVVPQNAPDGDYIPTLSWRDQAGNEAELSFVSPPIRIKCTKPLLQVAQEQLTFVRSPAGSTADEALAAGAHTIPAGPYFALAPGDGLDPSLTILANTFSIESGAPVRVRVWSDSAGSSLLGTLTPNADGTWPRQRLANLDTKVAYVSALDIAGNESARISVTHGEWVALARQTGFAQSAHLLQGTRRVASALNVEPSALVAVDTNAAAGVDGNAVVIASESEWRERTRASSAPSGRRVHHMAYDGVRARVVMFGGARGNESLDEHWEWNGERWRQAIKEANWPSRRTGSPMVYDSARDRVVMFGGNASAALDELWEWSGAAWEQRFWTGDGPGPRLDHALAYDSRRGHVLAFGGASATEDRTQDLWRWDGERWTNVTPPGAKPSARTHAIMSYDAKRDRVVLFGGRTPSTVNDVWEWNGTSWEELSPADPKPSNRTFASLAYDANNERVLLFGGAVTGGRSDELWEWNGTSWTLRAPLGDKPAARSGASVAYDEARGEILLFGGELDGDILADDTWVWNGTSWRTEISSLDAPRARREAMTAYDTTRRRVVLFSGQEDVAAGASAGDLWEWDGRVYTEHAVPVELATRRFGAMAYDASRGLTVLFGGESGVGDHLSDVWTWNGLAWDDETPMSGRPDGRYGHVMAYDSANERVLIFGGITEAGVSNQLWAWNGASFEALVPADGVSPPARRNPAVAYDSVRDRLVLFGGSTSTISGFLQDTWEWDNVTSTWHQLSPMGAKPSARRGVMTFDESSGRVVLVGGDPGFPGVLADIWEWDGETWRDVTQQGAKPQARLTHGLLYDAQNEQVIVLMGSNRQTDLGDLWERKSDPARRPGLQLRASFAEAGIATSEIVGLTARAHCGGTFTPFGATDVGAALDLWSPTLMATPGGAWSQVASHSNAASSWLFFRASSAEHARRYVRERDRLLTAQCRPLGGSGSEGAEATLTVDAMELRVNYLSP